MSFEERRKSMKKIEFITFSIGEQDFCMDIVLVREIRGWSKVTTLPRSPADVLGVMNLRGAVVPIVDLSARLGLGRYDATDRDVIIITLIGDQTVGFVVTAVSDIVELSHDNIQPMPNIGEGTENRFVKGIVTSDDKTLRVLDINNIGDSMAQACEIA